MILGQRTQGDGLLVVCVKIVGRVGGYACAIRQVDYLVDIVFCLGQVFVD